MMRYEKLDELRGLTLISMVLYHCLWDLNYIFGHYMGWYMGSPGYIWQQSICRSFILLSGFCAALEPASSRAGLRRGLDIFACGALVTAVTLIFMPQEKILFGVLTLLGSCRILVHFAGKWLRRLIPIFAFIPSLLVFELLFHVLSGLRTPEGLHGTAALILAYLGFPGATFFSSDYFPLLPWLFLYLAGYFLSLLVQRTSLMNKLKEGHFPPLIFMGRHSLLIYLLHQPLIYGVLYLVR